MDTNTYPKRILYFQAMQVLSIVGCQNENCQPELILTSVIGHHDEMRRGKRKLRM